MKHGKGESNMRTRIIRPALPILVSGSSMPKTELLALAVFVALATVLTVPGAQQAPRLPREDLPMTGKAGPGLEALDEAMKNILFHHGIPGGALAIAKEG